MQVIQTANLGPLVGSILPIGDKLTTEELAPADVGDERPVGVESNDLAASISSAGLKTLPNAVLLSRTVEIGQFLVREEITSYTADSRRSRSRGGVCGNSGGSESSLDRGRSSGSGCGFINGGSGLFNSGGLGAGRFFEDGCSSAQASAGGAGLARTGGDSRDSGESHEERLVMNISALVVDFPQLIIKNGINE